MSTSSGTTASPPIVQPFKYASHLKEIQGCPPRDLAALQAVGYRFTFSNIGDPRNFEPVALLTPARQVGNVPASKCCSAYALSLFSSEQALIDRAAKIMKTSPKFLDAVGDHYAELKLSTGDGESTPTNAAGHFSFFQRAHFAPVSAVQTHKKLP
jgi:hypothetical protein